jgi:ferrochelatase
VEELTLRVASKTRLAVVLFNLGGPDGLGAVRPFLENLFSDPAIIGLPWVLRRPLAAVIARAREKSAKANYAVMGGGSPLTAQTRDQAAALQKALKGPTREAKVFVAMRHWAPMSAETAARVRDYAPDDIVLAPLYPQYSTTTTASSLKAWRAAYDGPGESRAICCWYDNAGLARAHAREILETWRAAGKPRVRLLFSAHGLPEKVVAGGDPYRWQVEASCARVAAALGAGWDWRICYQSRVGPLKWIGPSTAEEIERAGAEGIGVLIDPIAFVSEHVETLVELDRDYAELAKKAGVPVYLRAPTVRTAPAFIDGLADAVLRALDRSGDTPDGAACPAGFSQCGRREARG